MSTPFVSVIVPVYNERVYLKRCVEALVAQDYPNDRYELIVVDDGSTDVSPEIAQRQIELHRRELPRMTYARLCHGGLSNARNAGLTLAKGEIIAYIDGDALAEPDWLRKLVDAFGNDPRVGVVGGKINPLNDEVPFAEFIHWAHYFWPDRRQEERVLVIGTNMAFRRSVFERVGGFFTNFWQRGDETAFLLKAQRFFSASTTQAAVVRHERPAAASRWLRERYYNGYFYAAVPYILRQVGGLANRPADLLRYLVLLNNALLPLWVGAWLIWPIWPLMTIALVTWSAFAGFLWSRRRIGLRLGVLRSQYSLFRAIVLTPYAIGLIALGEYLRAMGFLAGLVSFRGDHFEDDIQGATETIEYVCTNSDL